METVDFHNHFFPPEYLEKVKNEPSRVRVTYDSDGNPLLHYPGDYNIVVPGHRDIHFRSDVLAEAGVSRQIVTLTSPGTHIEEPQRAVIQARIVNDAFARIMNDMGERFSSLATLPLNDPAASVIELERAICQLGFKGVMLFSNVNGVGLDHKDYWPLYEKAEELGAVCYIHPINPLGVEAMENYWLMPLVGFTFDTTLAAAKLVFSGIVEKFPAIRWVLAHLGGAIPYLAERLDRGFEAFQACRFNINKHPSEYLKTFYYDTVNFDSAALNLALKFAGPGHLLAGSDYPHQIGSLSKMISCIRDLPISEAEKGAILGGNAIDLLGLN